MLRWRSLLSLKSSFSSSSSAATRTILAPFHSTSVLSEKSRKPFGSDRASKGGSTSNSSKTSSARFTCTVKEKGRRTAAKKTLDSILFHKGLNDPLQNEWNFGANPLIRDRHMKKKSPPGRGKKPRDKKTKRWHREGNTDDDFDADTTFNKFDNKWREAWTNHSQKKSSYSYSRDSTSGFHWTEGWSWTTQSQWTKTWNHEKSCDEPLIVGSQSERNALDLPLTGPLKLQDVKNAFRSSAKKWHPDMHQGPSQAAAQEKFKLCVEAYDSLCSALS